MITPLLITKRNSNVVIFDSTKIYNSIDRARIETGEFEKSEIEGITNKVLLMVEKDNRYDEISADDVRNYVQIVLIEENKPLTAEAYMKF